MKNLLSGSIAKYPFSIRETNSPSLTFHWYGKETKCKMQKYHKVVLNGKAFYREFDDRTGYYGKEILTGNQLIQQMLEEIVFIDEIKVDHEMIDYAISIIPTSEHKEMVKKYLGYLEMVVESLE